MNKNEWQKVIPGTIVNIKFLISTPWDKDKNKYNILQMIVIVNHPKYLICLWPHAYRDTPMSPVYNSAFENPQIKDLADGHTHIFGEGEYVFVNYNDVEII